MGNPQKVKRLFDDISGTYDILNRLLSFSIDKRWRKKGVAKLPHGDSVKILDLASGTMDLALQYTQNGPGKVWCVDFSMPMLTQGLSKVSPDLNQRIIPVCADGLRLPFPDRYFDAAMCAYGMRNLELNKKGLKELYRVLKPGASLLILEFFRPTTLPAKIFYNTYGRYIIPMVGNWFSRNKKAYQYLQSSIRNYYSLSEYQELMKEYGFKILQAKNFSGGISSMILASNSGHGK